MSLGFLNLAMLAGLAAVAIPVLIHLLHRRRFQVVDWGAMQFLQISETTRRRLLIEELILLALRMGLIAILVLGLAAPYAVSAWLSGLQGRANRDVVLVIDMTSSMTRTDGAGTSTFQHAQAWADDFLAGLRHGDRVAVLLARQPPEWLVADLTHDVAAVRERIGRLPGPRGSPDWPRAVTEAHRLLRERGQQNRQDVVLLSDQQRFGWSDPETLARWQKGAGPWSKQQRRDESSNGHVVPNLWLVAAEKELSSAAVNYFLAPLKTTRPLAWSGQRLKFSGTVHLHGTKDFAPPYRLFFEADGQKVEDIAVPANAGLNANQFSFEFQHRFTAPGTHLVSVVMEPDLPPEQRGAGYLLRDCLPADNRQDLAVEVVRDLRVLLIDGDKAIAPESSTFFLEKALGGPADAKQPAAVTPRVVTYIDFSPAMLEAPAPSVVVLADVPRLTAAQAEALEKFAAEGGGVLVALGPRAAKEAPFYNDMLYRQGLGWLPARLDQPEGDEARADFAAAADAKRFQHPALELFQREEDGAFGKVRFPRWWKVTTPSGTAGVPVAMLSSGDPFLVELAYKKGRVLLCTVPFDRSWGSNFPGQWEFPVLAHELVFALAAARSGALNLQPGQPARLPPQALGLGVGSAPDRLVLTAPSGKVTPVEVESWPWTFTDTGEIGPYRAESPEGATAYFAVQGDARESDLTPASGDDHKKLARYLPIRIPKDGALEHDDQAAQRQDLWWLFMMGVILMLCLEVFWTRRMALAR